MREIYTIKRITSCRPELLTLPYSHKGCQRSPTKLVYRRQHRSGREQVKRLLFGRRSGRCGGGETSFFFTSAAVMNGLLIGHCTAAPRARVCVCVPLTLFFLLIIFLLLLLLLFFHRFFPKRLRPRA